MSVRQKPSPEPGGRLSIGALARATGIPIDTLRTWERRHGYPVPERKPSGHRVYPLECVVRLRRIAEALALGHRAGEVVPASDGQLTALLSAMPGRGASPEQPSTLHAPVNPDDLIPAVRALDGESLRRALLGEWARLGPLDFLEKRIQPLLARIGELWQAGELDVRYEHVLSETVGDLLRTLRLPFEERAAGPTVALATLPGERHGLGLQMAALALSVAGCRVVNAGVDLPVEEIASLARELRARAVGLSLSTHGRGSRTTTLIRHLRQALPRQVILLLGGEGARPVEGAETMPDLAALEAWGRRMTTLAG